MGARCWQLLQDELDMAAVCQQLLREYEVDPVQLELDLQQLMTQLSEAGLVKIG